MKEKQFKEAVKRMKCLKIDERVIQMFEKNRTINCSINYGLYSIETINFGNLKNQIEEFEKENDALVYHVINTKFNELGNMFSFLYVCKTEEEWSLDMEDIENSFSFCWVWNETYPCDSDFGSISIESKFGGLKRIG